jgi:hypothetical protein
LKLYYTKETIMPKKGQSLSPQAIEKMKLSKLRRMRSKYKWDLIESYAEETLEISSRNRSKKFITLSEFKELIEDGKSIKEINKITSKHLVQFYSNFSQGKIKLSKEEFIEQYNKGLSLDEIAEKNKIARDDLTYLRQLYGQKNKGATFINRKKTEVFLTERQKDVLYGSMMGDAQKGSFASASFKHGDSQKDYLLWKYEIFKSVASEYSLKGEIYIDKRSEYEGKTWRFYTHANTDIEKCMRLFYLFGRKEITKEILNHLTPLSLAVWYQDDGGAEYERRGGYVEGKKGGAKCYLCTDSYSKESCENIKKWFFDKFNIDVYLKERKLSNRIGYRIRMDCLNSEKFINLISPYILPMFNYKICYKEYLLKRRDNESQVVDGDMFSCPLGVDFNYLPFAKQEQYISDFVDFYHRKGLDSLVEKPDNWKNHMMSVINANEKNIIKDEYISFNNIGNKFLLSHFPNFWDGRAKGNKSPREIFENKEYLSEILRSIISKGYFPNESKVLKGLSRYRGNKKISGFMPCVSKAIYFKYCDENSRVFDFCAGYGGRLFGAMACDKIESYTGLEVNFKTYCGLNELYRDLRVHADISKEMNVFNQDSIMGMKQFSDKVFDFCFTSPPYFDAEEYDESDSQSSKKYNSYGEWFDNYLIKSIKEAIRISKKVAINIANTGGYMIADDLERWLESNNISYVVDKIKMPNYGGEFKFEPIYIF